MRLKEPFQGIKTLNGHIVMHVAMFIVSWHIDTSLYYDGPDEWEKGGTMKTK